MADATQAKSCNLRSENLEGRKKKTLRNAPTSRVTRGLRELVFCLEALLARIPKSSFVDQPDQLAFFDRLRRRRTKPATAIPAAPPIIASAKPSLLRRAMTSGISATSGVVGDVVKEGVRDAAVSGVRWAVIAVVGGAGISGYMLWPAKEQTGKPPSPPSQIETGAIPTKVAPPSPATVTPLKPLPPQTLLRGARFKKKPNEKTTTTRIFILEDLVEWLKHTPGQ